MSRYYESYRLGKSISLVFYRGYMEDSIYFIIHIYSRTKIFHKSLDARFYSVRDAFNLRDKETKKLLKKTHLIN